MSIPNSNLSKVQMSGSNSSLKVVAEGSDIIIVAGLDGGYIASGMTSVPHNGQTDNLIWQVSLFSNLETDGNNIPTPFESNDDRALLHSYVSSTDLFVEAAYQSNTGDLTSFEISFYYRVLLP